MKKESAVAKKKTQNAHKELMKFFLKCPVTDVKFSGNRISLTFFGDRICDKCTIKRVTHVAEWSRRRKEIFIDKKFGEKERKTSFRALCIHEMIERFLVEKYGLNTDNEAHIVATQKEREYLAKHKGNWKSHEMEVFWDWHKLGEK